MTPETKLADFARRLHLQDDDVDYLLSLLQEARGLGSLAGAVAEREACIRAVESIDVDEFDGCPGYRKAAADAIRKRSNP